MNKITLSAAGILAAGCMAFTSPAIAAGDAAVGAKVARTWCIACHVVDKNRAEVASAPSFIVLAATKTQSQLKAFLTRPHGRMPNIQLSNQQIADVLAFFETLK